MNDGGGGRPVAVGVSMVPWVERPSIDIDLDRPPDKRYAAVPQEAFAAGKRLLAAVMEQVPSLALLLADWVRLRTAGRFHREAVGLARQVGVSWRPVMLANVSYALVLAALGGPAVGRPAAPRAGVGPDLGLWSAEMPG